MRKIVILGANGYFGKNLLKYLSKEHFDVTCVVRKMPKIHYKQFKYLICDILDRKQLMAALQGNELVIDLAAIINSINESKFNNNILMTRNIVESMSELGIMKLIYFSTHNVYLKKKGPYAKSKVICEEIIRNSDLQYIILRPNYIYGVDKKNRFYNLALQISHFHCSFIAGKALFQPILKDDLSKITVEIIKNFQPYSIFDISGNDRVSMEIIAAKLEQKLNCKSFRIRLPLLILELLAFFIKFDRGSLTENRITNNNYNFNYTSLDKSLDTIIKLINQ